MELTQEQEELIATYRQHWVLWRPMNKLGFTKGNLFAAKAWTISDEAFRSISGRKFDWVDTLGREMVDGRDEFERPNSLEAVKLCMTPALMGAVEAHHAWRLALRDSSEAARQEGLSQDMAANTVDVPIPESMPSQHHKRVHIGAELHTIMQKAAMYLEGLRTIEEDMLSDKAWADVLAKVTDATATLDSYGAAMLVYLKMAKNKLDDEQQ
jgi:hypothetical protein